MVATDPASVSAALEVRGSGTHPCSARPQAFPAHARHSVYIQYVADMFHEGSLQSGIALAIQEQKLVACFVRGN